MKRLVPLAALALLAAPAALAGEINVTFSPEFTEELNDEYGMREADYLIEEVQEDLTRELKKAGVDVARIDVTIIDARPSKPTFKQLGDEPGLDYGASRSTGGFRLTAAKSSPSTSDWLIASIAATSPVPSVSHSTTLRPLCASTSFSAHRISV